jgi:2,3-bisphosphoglycerate-dependent phosphoglycerate mutase
MTAEDAIVARLVLVRHGESEANAANVFTGRADVPLTERGRDQARRAARALDARGWRPARVFLSTRDRCRETAALIVREACPDGVPLVADDALDERDYGRLTGLNKNEAARMFGEAQVRAWRRSYESAPPEGESLRDTAARVLAYYVHRILPDAMAGDTTLVIAHGNSLRALVMALDDLDKVAVEALEIPTGSLRCYGLSATTAVRDLTTIIP